MTTTEEAEEMLFFKSLLSYVGKLTPTRRMFFRSKVQLLLMEEIEKQESEVGNRVVSNVKLPEEENGVAKSPCNPDENGDEDVENEKEPALTIKRKNFSVANFMGYFSNETCDAPLQPVEAPRQVEPDFDIQVPVSDIPRKKRKRNKHIKKNKRDTHERIRYGFSRVAPFSTMFSGSHIYFTDDDTVNTDRKEEPGKEEKVTQVEQNADGNFTIETDRNGHSEMQVEQAADGNSTIKTDRNGHSEMQVEQAADGNFTIETDRNGHSETQVEQAADGNFMIEADRNGHSQPVRISDVNESNDHSRGSMQEDIFSNLLASREFPVVPVYDGKN